MKVVVVVVAVAATPHWVFLLVNRNYIKVKK